MSLIELSEQVAVTRNIESSSRVKLFIFSRLL